MSAASAREVKPAPAGDYEGVYMLPVDDEYEQRIAKRYFDDRYGEQNKATGWPKLAGKIPLPKLNQRAIVVPIIRGEDRTPAIKYFRDMNGSPHQERVPIADLATEVRECPRVKVADHWAQARDDWDAFGGELIKPQFLEALGKSCTPVRPMIHIGNEHELRLTFL